MIIWKHKILKDRSYLEDIEELNLIACVNLKSKMRRADSKTELFFIQIIAI